jgi:predicted ribosome quality control (RQC) complex YloA/Tae2 family protein
MIKNYFLLNRLTTDLNKEITGSRIISAFSQEKDKLTMELLKKGESLFMEISVSQRFPYITVKERFSRGKKNTVNLFNNFLPAVVENFSIAHLDRIIKIKTDMGDFYSYIRGNKTNIIAVADELYTSFKKISDEEAEAFITEFRNLVFTADKTEFIPGDDETLSNKDYLKKYPFLGKEILSEADLRRTGSRSSAVQSVIEDLWNKKPAVYTGEKEVRLAVEDFRLFEGYKKEVFDTLLTAVNYYISRKFSTELFFQRKRNLLTSVENELERTASRINSLKGRIEAGSKEDIYNKYANLLLINLKSFEKGAEEIEVEDIYRNNDKVRIKVDPSLSPQKNADKYFEKSRSEKINYLKSKELFESSLIKYDKLREQQKMLSEIDSPEELKKMDTSKKESGRSGDKDDLKDKFRQYLIDGKYKLYVGTDSERNDLLTTRFAKQNDYWFHARGVSGSHVVLRVENTKEPVPKPVLKKAASIAAYHSKAKTSSLAPVAYTLKKYVVKKKGMETGKVSLLKEGVLLVKLGIPPGCEYISKE